MKHKLILIIFMVLAIFSRAQPPMPPIIVITPVTGNNIACQGTPSAFPHVQQFQVSGSFLIGSVQVSATQFFEVSTNPFTGYSTFLSLLPSGGIVLTTIIYVRQTASIPGAGTFPGQVQVASTLVPNQFNLVSATVNLTPVITPVSNKVYCKGDATTPISFSGMFTTSFTWTNSNTAIGIGPGGTGTIPAFTATNNGTSPISSTLTVTPFYTNGGVSCAGAPTNFTITVNPTPTVNLVTNQVKCNGTLTDPVSFSGSSAGNQYNWVNNNTSIGLGASGTGNIPAFTATNNGTSPITSTLSVTPFYTNAGVTCAGPPTNFTITVNPIPTVNTVNNQVKCNGTLSDPVSFSGSFAGTQYNWLNNNTGIGLGASGTGNINAFTVINTGNTVSGADITYYPYYTNAGKTCTGNAKFFSITVNPSSNAAIASQNITQTLPVNGITYFSNGCTDRLITKVNPNGSSPINGSTTAKVWIENTQPAQFVKRHYEITPSVNAPIATGRITLYFTQTEFDNFNTVNTVDLPTGPNDAVGKANLLIEKRPGTSSNGSGLPGSYSGTPLSINPNDADIVWNAAHNRWEITFDVTGFSGFWIKTIGGVLPLQLLDFSGSKQSGFNKLKWKTANEINTKAFELQKSGDGQTYTTITTIAAIGSNDNNYYFNDYSSFSGKTFYRLKITDSDGSYTYSNIIWISNDAPATVIQVYPNPVKDVMTVKGLPVGTTAIITDVSGRVLQRIITRELSFTIYMGKYCSGVYMLKADNGETKKIMKE